MRFIRDIIENHQQISATQALPLDDESSIHTATSEDLQENPAKDSPFRLSSDIRVFETDDEDIQATSSDIAADSDDLSDLQSSVANDEKSDVDHGINGQDLQSSLTDHTGGVGASDALFETGDATVTSTLPRSLQDNDLTNFEVPQRSKTHEDVIADNNIRDVDAVEKEEHLGEFDELTHDTAIKDGAVQELISEKAIESVGLGQTTRNGLPMPLRERSPYRAAEDGITSIVKEQLSAAGSSSQLNQTGSTQVDLETNNSPSPFHNGSSASGSAAPSTDRGKRSSRAKTRLLGFQSGAANADPLARLGRSKKAQDEITLPVGWLVIIGGPGLGRSFQLAAGVAQIGRAEPQDIRIDFGDSSISRENHAAIAYDIEQNAFFIGHGGKANIVRRNNRPVLSTEELTSGDVIRIGETTLRFVSLCGPDFSWDDAHQAGELLAGQ